MSGIRYGYGYQQTHYCCFCHTTEDVKYCESCGKWMCDSCSKQYWTRAKAAVNEWRYKHGLGGREYY